MTHLRVQPTAVENVVPTPFGLIRIWNEQGQTFIAETASDGSVIGPALALAGADVASGLSAVVHQVETSFFLTVTWLGGARFGAGPDVLLKSFQLGRSAQGLSLTAANDNPIVIGAGAVETGLVALPGEDLLLTWVDAGTGQVFGQVRHPLPDAPAPPPFSMGHTAIDGHGTSRRVHVVEIAPLEYAVLWLASSRRDLEGVSLTKDLLPRVEGAGTWISQPMPPVSLEASVAGDLTVTADRASQGLAIAYDALGPDGTLAAMHQSVPFGPGQGRGAVHSAMQGLVASNDFGFIWAAQDLLQLAPSALYAPGVHGLAGGPLFTRGDEPVLIDPAAYGAGQGIKIVAVDGAPLSDEGPTRIAHGWMQARADGHLLFTPDVDAAGHLRLLLSGISDHGTAWNRHLDVHVQEMFEAAVQLRNPVKTLPAHAVIAHNAQMAEIGFIGDASPHGAISLSGLDADKFVVIGNGLFLRGGTRIEPGRKALDVAVHYKDGLAGAALAASLSIAVMNDPSAMLSFALPGRAHAAEISAGAVVAEMGVEQALGSDRISLALLSNAGGRFALAGGNLVVASPHLFTVDPEAAYEVVVRATKPNGVAIDHKISLHHGDVAGRLPPPPERGAEATAEKATAPPVVTDAQSAPGEAAVAAAEHAAAVRGEAGGEAPAPAHEASGEAHVLPALNVEAHAPQAKGTSAAPDLGTGAGTGPAPEAQGLAKVVAQQQRDAASGEHASHEGRSSHAGSGREESRADKYERELIESFRNLGRSGEGRDGRDERGSNSGEHQKAHAGGPGDTLFFKPGFGKETIEHVKLSGGEAHDILDLSLYGTTFEALRAAGAFEQVGNDVVLTLNPADPAHSDQIILKSIELHQLDPGDFKFS